jgi:mono/diheme cytochrome c family protein
MRWVWIAAALLASRAAVAQDDPVPLKPGPGSDITAASCNACHTSNYIVMNSVFLSPTAWTAEVTKMRTTFAAPIDDATASIIEAYLGANYAVTR